MLIFELDEYNMRALRCQQWGIAMNVEVSEGGMTRSESPGRLIGPHFDMPELENNVFDSGVLGAATPGPSHFGASIFQDRLSGEDNQRHDLDALIQQPF